MEIHNNKIITINSETNNRYILFFEEPFDISVIQIKDEDLDIRQKVDCLDYDKKNYIGGYYQNNNDYLFAFDHPYGDEVVKIVVELFL